MGFSFNRISDFFVVLVLVVVVVVVQEVLHERGFSELGASRAKNYIFLFMLSDHPDIHTPDSLDCLSFLELQHV